MRLIDADALKASIPETDVDIFENCRTCTTLMDYEVKDLINNQPTIPAPRWHRVEEPPKPFEMVIAYVDPWHIFAAYHNGHGYWKENDGFNVIGVRYWMPIEPPKEDA